MPTARPTDLLHNWQVDESLRIGIVAKSLRGYYPPDSAWTGGRASRTRNGMQFMVHDFSMMEFNRPSDSHSSQEGAKRLGANLLPLLVVVGSAIGLLSGCNTARFGQRTDTFAESETSVESADADNAKKSKGLAAMFGSWWTGEAATEDEEAVEETLENRRKDGSKLGDQGRVSSASRSNALSKKKNNDLSDELAGSELTTEQQELFKKQYQAAKNMGWVGDPEIEEMLADMERAKPSNEDLVSLPPTDRNLKGSNGTINDSSLAASSVAPAASAPVASGAPEVTSASFRFSDAAPSPVTTAAGTASVDPSGLPVANAVAPNNQAQTPGGSGVVNAVATAATATVPTTSTNALPVAPGKTDMKSLTLAPLPLLPSSNNAAPAPGKVNQASNLSTAAPTNLPVSTSSGAAPVSPLSNVAAPSATPVVATSTIPTTSWEDDMQQAIQKLRDRLSNGKELTPKERQQLEARLRMMYLAANQLDSSLQPVETWDNQEKEWFRNTLQALYHAYDTEGPESRSRRFSLVAERQRAANQHLAAISNLEVRNLEFCSAVESYGLITRFPTNSFKADQMVLLYCEIENFATISVPEGYETEFKANYEIVDLAGNRVSEQSLPTDRQKCRNWRRDYFIAYRFHLPKDLVPGKYQLKLNIEDLKGKKFGQSSVEFTITP